MWAGQAEAMGEHYTILRYDTRGHGASVATPGPYRIADLADDVVAIMDVLELQQVNFCGLSMGGMIGLWLGMHAPSRLKRLIVANSAPQIAPAELWNERIATVRRGGMQAIAEGVAQRWFTAGFIAREPDTVNAIKRMIVDTPLEGYVSCCAAVRDFDVRQDMGNITLPVMVIAGDADPATPPQLTMQISQAIAASRFESLPAAHLSNIESRVAFNRTLNDFLKP
jgi:3-oxoadipate enol-lactonase